MQRNRLSDALKWLLWDRVFPGVLPTRSVKTTPRIPHRLAGVLKTKKGLPCANTTSPNHKMLEASNG